MDLGVTRCSVMPKRVGDSMRIAYPLQHGARVIHEYNDEGAHRLRIDDRTTPPDDQKVSDWHNFKTPIFFEGYIAFTDYFVESVYKAACLPIKQRL